MPFSNPMGKHLGFLINIICFLGFPSLKEQWIERYETDDFGSLISKVWTEKLEIGGKTISLEMFYKQLHAYVRSKLRQFYNPQASFTTPQWITILTLCFSNFKLK